MPNWMEEFTTTNRRTFLRNVALGAAAVGTLGAFSTGRKKEDLVKLTVLHTNDMHSRIEPFPDTDPKYPGLGGMEKRAAMIKKIRSKESNLLLLDAGDIFQGTPYFNIYGGELEYKLMSMMGYDAATMGNHDFDNGLEGFNKMLPFAQFPFVCSNYDFKDTILKDKTIPYKIIRKEGVKIGIFGLGVELEGLVNKNLYGDTIYQDPIAISKKYAKLLKYDHQCDLVICLSHLGYEYKTKKIGDRILAGETEDIDLIIGGHTHTFLEKAQRLQNKSGKEVLVNQVGWAGINLGRVDFYFDRVKGKNLVGNQLHASMPIEVNNA